MNRPDRIHAPEGSALFGYSVHRITPANAWQILELLGIKEGDVVIEWPAAVAKPSVMKRETWEEITKGADL